MSSAALISVVMPSYNSGQTLRGSMGSALGQTHRQLELVVVDDGSTDDSVAIVRELQATDPRVKLIQSPGNEGAARARNAGIRAAAGPYLAFLDSDDTWTPDCLEKLLAALEARPSASQAYCGWQNQGLEPRRCQPYVPPDYEGEKKLEHYLGGCPYPIHAVLSKTEAIVAEGGFDERLTSCMDFDLWLRVGWCREVVRAPEVMAFYYHHQAPHRISLNRMRVALNHFDVQRRFIAAHPEIEARLGAATVRRLIHGELLQRGMEAYWERDLAAARPIFRTVMRSGYGDLKAWRYMLPSVLPESWQARLIELLSGRRLAANVQAEARSGINQNTDGNAT